MWALIGWILTLVDFSLPDSRGQQHALSEWRDSSVVVVAFLGCECPVARQYAARLNEVNRDFRARGVVVIGINANPGDSAQAIGRFERELHLDFPILRDVNQSLARRLGITRQPEMVVLDRARRVRYQGRFDDQFSPGAHRAKASRADLVCAIEELLAGRQVTIPRTEPAGCPIERLPPKADKTKVSFEREIAPILSRHCVSCHQPGGIGPFSFATGADAARWAGAIREAVHERRMPPWHADPKVGHFANDPSLSSDQRRVIEAWVDAGSPIDRDVALTGASSPSWSIQTPDKIISMPAEFAVPPSGDIPYQVIEVDPGFTHDVWVQQAEIRPGNRAVVHHSTVFLRPPGVDSLVTQGELKSFCLCAYAMGTPPMILPSGMAKKIPAGWRLVFVMHYVGNGTAQTDQTTIGLKTVPAAQVRQEVATNILMAEEMTIPPRCEHHVETRSRRFESDVLLLALFPHMHLRGISFRFDVTYPNGQTETLLSVPKWDMDWQHRYVLAEPKRLPAGTVLTATGIYDNSAKNPINPDPDAEVKAGPQTSDEMFNGYYDFCLADQDLTVAKWQHWLRQPWVWAAALGLLAAAWLVRRRAAR